MECYSRIMSCGVRSKSRGSILVVILLVLSVLAILVAVVAQDGLGTLQGVGKASRQKQAKYAATAGLQKVMNEIGKAERIDVVYRGESVVNADTGLHVGHLPNMTHLRYEVQITNNMEADLETGSPLRTPDGRDVPPGTVYLHARGFNEENGADVQIAGMIGLARKTRPNFDDAAYARNYMRLQNTIVDAWNSVEDGSYDDGSWDGSDPDYNAPVEDRPGNLRGAEATVGGDGGHREALVLQNSTVDGFAAMAPQAVPDGHTLFAERIDSDDPPPVVAALSTLMTADPKANLKDKTVDVPRFQAPFTPADAAANGSRTVNNPKPKKPKDPPDDWKPGPPPPYELDPGPYEEVTVRNNQKLILRSGVYYFSEKFEITNAEIELDIRNNDPVTIFFGKKAIFNGATVNQYGSTHDLHLCFTDEEKDPDLILSEFAGIPDAQLRKEMEDRITPAYRAKLESKRKGYSFFYNNGSSVHAIAAGSRVYNQQLGGEFFGAIVAGDLFVRNAELHQDLSLSGAQTIGGGTWTLEGVHETKD